MEELGARKAGWRSRAAWNLLALVACGSVLPALAQEQVTGSDWGFVVEPYVMFPNMQGKAGIGVLPDLEVDEDPGDIFSHLEMGAMLYLEAHNDKWALSSDVLYMKLGSDVTPGAVISSGDVELSQVGWELAVMRRMSAWLELGAALAYNEIDVGLSFDFNGPAGIVPAAAKLKEDWIDPSLLARATFPLSGNWFLRGRANMGGFGIGSDFMWQIQVDAGYRFSERSYMTLGYRVIDMDYESGSGADRFRYDIANFGPTLRFGFSF